MKKHSIYIVEDHLSMRELLRDFIDLTPDLCTCGAAETAEQAVEELATVEASLLLIDISLPVMNGFELTSRVQATWPELPCLLLSGHRDAAYVQKALAHGARGYVTKGDVDELTFAIRHVLDGGTYTPGG